MANVKSGSKEGLLHIAKFLKATEEKKMPGWIYKSGIKSLLKYTLKNGNKVTAKKPCSFSPARNRSAEDSVLH